ncbi:MAG TPA: hypothetical protein DCP90_07025 [Clostridiales bacterium]|nr:MAG: hypothetical protein A2Y22_02305 [Clostridiales bacterium GWD2_32_59]HAN10348.1 hypothetical protein [Clostridiales bacterium]
MGDIVNMRDLSTRKIIIKKVESIAERFNMGYSKEDTDKWVGDLIQNHSDKTIEELSEEVDDYFFRVNILMSELGTYLGDEYLELFFMPNLTTGNKNINFMETSIKKLGEEDIDINQFEYLMAFYRMGFNEEDSYRLVNEIDLNDEERLKYIINILDLDTDKGNALNFVISPHNSIKELQDMQVKLWNDSYRQDTREYIEKSDKRITKLNMSMVMTLKEEKEDKIKEPQADLVLTKPDEGMDESI